MVEVPLVLQHEQGELKSHSQMAEVWQYRTCQYLSLSSVQYLPTSRQSHIYLGWELRSPNVLQMDFHKGNCVQGRCFPANQNPPHRKNNTSEINKVRANNYSGFWVCRYDFSIYPILNSCTLSIMEEMAIILHQFCDFVFYLPRSAQTCRISVTVFVEFPGLV